MAVEKPTPCYICWFFTISLAIVTGTLLTDALRAGITYLSFDKYSNSIIQNSDSEDSSVNEATEPKKELPIVKLSPKTDIPSANLSPEQEQSNKDIFIKVLPDKGIPKEKKSGYQTTLQTCKYWTKEYEKEATRKNAAYKEAACKRLESYE